MEKEQEIIRTSLRLPKRLYDLIASSAEERGLTMHAEILAQLEKGFDTSAKTDANLSKEFSEMRREIKRLLWGTRLTGRAIEKAAEGDRRDLDYLIGVAKEMPLLLPITEEAERDLNQVAEDWLRDDDNSDSKAPTNPDDSQGEK